MEMKRISDEEIVRAFREAHQDYFSGSQHNFWRVVHHGMDAQLEADQKVLREMVEEIENSFHFVSADDVEMGDLDLSVGDRIFYCDSRWQAFKKKYGV